MSRENGLSFRQMTASVFRGTTASAPIALGLEVAREMATHDLIGGGSVDTAINAANFLATTPPITSETTALTLGTITISAIDRALNDRPAENRRQLAWRWFLDFCVMAAPQAAVITLAHFHDHLPGFSGLDTGSVVSGAVAIIGTARTVHAIGRITRNVAGADERWEAKRRKKRNMVAYHRMLAPLQYESIVHYGLHTRAARPLRRF